jgi:hypothetical protein
MRTTGSSLALKMIKKCSTAVLLCLKVSPRLGEESPREVTSHLIRRGA